MRYRKLGQSDIEASVVAFGAWAIGGWMWGGTDEQAAIDAIQAGIDAGMNFIDTAAVYGFGLSETIVGKAIRGRRDQVVLATKCGLVWDKQQGQFYFDSQDADGHKLAVHKHLGAESIRREVEASLQRLGVDHIDLYQTHWQDPTTPIAETMGELLALKQAGKIRAIGVSNATVEQIDQYRQVGPVDTDQEQFSMLEQQLSQETLPHCRKAGIAVLAYSPLAQGLLTGKVTPDREFPAGDLRRDKPQFSRENIQRVNDMLARIKPIADGHNITLAQLTIAWTLAQPGLTHALCGARNPRQALENAAAGDVQLSAAELQTIDDAVAPLVTR